MTIADTKNNAGTRMKKTLDALRDEFSRIRTGRAHTGIIEHLKVNFYGSDVPLSQAANISVQDARTLVVTPWDKTLVPAIEKAILSSDLGLNPVSAGTVIRVPLPALTEERRRDMIKVVSKEAEAARVAIRNVRRDAISELKALLKDKKITEDEERRAQDEIQKLTDKHIADVDKLLAEKEKDVMAV